MKTITQELLDGLKNADDIKTFLDLHDYKVKFPQEYIETMLV